MHSGGGLSAGTFSCVHYPSAFRLALAQRSIPAKSVAVSLLLVLSSDSRNNNNNKDHIEFGVLWKHQAKRKALKVSDFKVLKLKKYRLTVNLTSCDFRELGYTVVTIVDQSTSTDVTRLS